MDKKAKRKELVDYYNRCLHEYGKHHTRTKSAQKKIEEFDKEHNKE